MEKLEITGWVGKTEFNKKEIWDVGRFPMTRIFRTKGPKLDWSKEDWPPFKVKVTIEKL